MSNVKNQILKSSQRVWIRQFGTFHLSSHSRLVLDTDSPSLYRLWDLAAGKTMTTLTHHHKSVRSLAIHPTEYSFASASSGGNNIKKWACPQGTFVHNFSGHDAIINTISVNQDGVMYSGADNGSMTFWDYKTGLCVSSTLSLYVTERLLTVLYRLVPSKLVKIW